MPDISKVSTEHPDLHISPMGRVTGVTTSMLHTKFLVGRGRL